MEETKIKPFILTDHCSSFPGTSTNEINREFVVRMLRDTFSSTQKVILVEGDPSTGKTTLLSQFAKTFHQNSFSFFIGDDYWGSNVYKFLSELCEQMKLVCSTKLAKKFANTDPSSLEEFQLKMMFGRLYNDIVQQARNNKGTFYFVIDGVDKIQPKNGEESILTYIPSGDPTGVYVLLSSTKGKKYNLTYTTWNIPSFSEIEAERYLENYLSKAEISSVFKACDGMPGYLNEIRRQISNGASKESLLNNLPSGFSELIEKQWKVYDGVSKEYKQVIAAVVFSQEVLTVNTLSLITGKNEKFIEEVINDITFLSINLISSNIEILSPYKIFLQDKLGEYKIDIQQLLIKYYEKNSQSSLIYLPELYRDNKNFEALVNLITPNNLVQMLEKFGQVSLVRRNLRALSEMSYNHSEWQKLSWGSLLEAVFTRIITAAPALEYEIDALLSLNNHTVALQLSYECQLPEDRLLLLAKVCKYMKEKGFEIHGDIIKAIEESVNLIDNSIDLSDELSDKLLDISSDLFLIESGLALRLIKRVVIETGTNNPNGKLMDLMLMKLALNLGPDAEFINEIKDQVKNEKAHDFVKATSTAIRGVSVEEVIEQANNISDISAKLYLIQTWCNTNSDLEDAYIVVEYALDLMTESEEYSPTQLHLRHFASPLLNFKDSEKLKVLVSRFDDLKETVIKNPIDEWVQLELILARIEKQWSIDDAVARFYKLYFNLDEVYESDTSCFILIRLLINIDKIINNDEKLHQELRNRFINEYTQLLNSSADQLNITKRLLRAVTIYDHELAFNFAKQINTQNRRDLAYAEILKVYTSSRQDQVVFSFIDIILDKILNNRVKNWVTVQVLRSVSTNCPQAEKKDKFKYLKYINSINNFIGKAYAYAHFLVWITNEEGRLVEDIFNKMIQTIESIDSNKERIKTGFRVVEIISKEYKDKANELFNRISKYKEASFFSDERLSDLYFDTCQLVIKMIPDIVRSDNYVEQIQYIKSSISCIPSILDQCTLLSSLAIRCLNVEKNDLFKEITQICLNLLEKCEDHETSHDIILNISPMLYEYERTILFEKVKELPSELQDLALLEVVSYIVSKRPPEDQVDLDDYRRKMDHAEVMKICDVLEYMNTDSTIYLVISNLVDLITENKNKLLEKHTLSYATKLVEIINKKLPDPLNIQHNGYKIASLACVAKLRDSFETRANARWKQIVPEWDSIKQEALQLPNSADKTFVLANAGSEAYFNNPTMGNDILNEAEKSIDNINNYIDRAERYQLVAKVYHKTSNESAAKFFLKQAMQSAQLCSNNESRDQLIGGIVELAHSVDQSLANNFASEIDNPLRFLQVSDTLLTLTLHSDPNRIDQYKKDESSRILTDFYKRTLKSFYSLKGITHHDEVIGKWLYQSLGHDYKTVNMGTTWYIENTIARKRNAGSYSELSSLFAGGLQLLEMVNLLGGYLSQTAATKNESERSFIKLMVPNNIETFSVGQGEEALQKIRNWLISNVNDYVKIYDPYFNEDMLEILKHISQTSRVTIMMSCKNSEVESIESNYKNKWKKICDHTPPPTQFFIYSTNSGSTPMHDRFIISDSAGVKLGTSLNGFGSKDSTITYLDSEEKLTPEQSIVDSLLYRMPFYHKDERLSMRSFTL